MNKHNYRWQAFRNTLFKGTHGSDPLWSRKYFEAILALDECYWCLGELTVNHDSGVPLDWMYGLRVARNCVPACRECIDIRQSGRFTFGEMELLRPGLAEIRRSRRQSIQPEIIPVQV